MKPFIFVWVVGIALSAAASAQAQGVTRTYDRFKNHTEFKVEQVELPKNVKMAGLFLCRGDVQSCQPESFYLLFSQVNDDGWEHMDSHPFTFLLNGEEPMDMGSGGYDGSVGDDYVIEFQNVAVSPERFAKLAAASKVEFQWTSTEGALPPKAMAAIRNLAKAATGPQTAP